jgi:putative ABC transport system permease protein
MTRLLQDVRHACSRLLRDRAFALIAILTLGLGIGANTAMFSLVQSVMLRPLPYTDAGRLIVVWNKTDRTEMTYLSLQEVASYRSESHTLADLGAYSETDTNLTGGQEPERVRSASVTTNLFAMLGVSALHGRGFVAEDGEPGRSDVVVLGHGLWQRRFGGSPAIVGQQIEMNGRARLVVGVMPPSFHLPTDFQIARPTEAWIPLVMDPTNLGQWGNRSYIGVGRLNDETTATAATSEFSVIASQWVRAGYVRAQPDGSLGGLERTAQPMPDFIFGSVKGPLLVLLGAVGFVLLIACANVANLMLARADVRRQEVAVRAALGAARSQVVRLLLTESVVLALVSGVFGLAVAWAASRLLVTLRPVGLPRIEDLTLDGSVLAATAVIAVVTGVLFGLAPALQLSRPGLTEALKDGGRSGTAGRSRQIVRRGLVVFQMASSVVLALGAGLLIRSLIELNRIDLGFNPSQVLTAQLQLSATDYPQSADTVRFYRELVDRAGALLGVTTAGAVRILPLARDIGDWSIVIEGRPRVAGENPNGDFQTATPGYFEAMGIPLVRGRFITAADREDAPLVVVINETMANRYWPGEDAIGKRFIMGTNPKPWLTIVGIVRTVRHNAIVEPPRAEMYVPHAQVAVQVGNTPRAMSLVLKTAGDPLALAGAVRETVRSLNRNLPVSEVRSMDEVTANALSQPRFTTLLLGLFAALALALAAIGIYGTVSLLVAERTQEMGIRLALGAARGTILRLILGQGMMVALAGLVLGLAGAAFLTRLLASLVYGVGTLDPVTFVAVPALLAVVAFVACLAPAHRAASVDPVLTLRRG